MIYRNKLKF